MNASANDRCVLQRCQDCGYIVAARPGNVTGAHGGMTVCPIADVLGAPLKGIAKLLAVFPALLVVLFLVLVLLSARIVLILDLVILLLRCSAELAPNFRRVFCKSPC
jgi:hypothetical protein